MAERFRIICYISIHAPAKGATGTARPRSAMTSHFNPRSREGSDIWCLAPSTSRSHFNPRSREGSDVKRGETTEIVWEFQSTLPRRERHTEVA